MMWSFARDNVAGMRYSRMVTGPKACNVRLPVSMYVSGPDIKLRFIISQMLKQIVVSVPNSRSLLTR